MEQESPEYWLREAEASVSAAESLKQLNDTEQATLRADAANSMDNYFLAIDKVAASRNEAIEKKAMFLRRLQEIREKRQQQGDTNDKK
jgi:hypothetical protein